MSERQQLAEAIRAWDNSDALNDYEAAATIVLSTLKDAGWIDPESQSLHQLLTEYLERGRIEGYERCKRDASAAIEAAYFKYPNRMPPKAHVWASQFKADALAALAALNAKQQEASDG